MMSGTQEPNRNIVVISELFFFLAVKLVIRSSYQPVLLDIQVVFFSLLNVQVFLEENFVLVIYSMFSPLCKEL